MKEKMLVFFDGECALCRNSLKWLNRLDGNDRLLFAPLQGETARENKIDRSDDSMAVIEDGEVWRSSEAVMRACLRAGGPGLILGGILLLIPRAVRDWGYRLVARNRKCLVKSETCGLPEEGLREKLVR